MKEHIQAKLVNKLTEIAREHYEKQRLRQLMSNAVSDALKENFDFYTIRNS